MTHVDQARGNRRGWRGFWEVGGLWRALAAAGIFVVVTFGMGWLLPVLTGVEAEADATLGGFWTMAVGGILPPAIAGIVTLLLVRSLGWTREIFGPQPVRFRRRGLWIGLGLIVALLAVRLVIVDYGSISLGTIGLLAVFVACVGFSEELAFRGVVTQLLRRGGDRERDVALGASAIFALVHVGNWVGLEGLSPINGIGIVFQLVFAFACGVLFHVVLVLTGRLVWPMVLHAAIDFASLAVVAQGVDLLPGEGAVGAALTVIFTLMAVVIGITMLFLIDGRVGREAYGLPEPDPERAQTTS
ncbi:CPBP family intramembrane glutamic endopeptidase [Demequina sp. NBRC 110057]|uniref:CPBP family intramembrane glutamic endopeptidase n=1 Tax=Demequina sp. NBRC 110057 TaxID=1570346 RepID=UPI0013566E6C|nr:type II CAAX endopeptidase family protein [Demequina sp. NBRC 110057]